MKTHRDVAKRVLGIEIDALTSLSENLSENFDVVVDLLRPIKGRIILVGVGKSGHIARKISATLASTGSASFYVHPTEASHGDMGMITIHDAVIALSRSGETKELADLIGYCGRFSIPLIGITAKEKSALGRAATHCLLLPDAPEACAETRAPTTSTTLQIALGDALAIALLEAKGFTAKDFQTFHPGGTFGASLLTLNDLMHGGDMLPLVDVGVDAPTALDVMSAKGFGCVGVTKDEALVGIVTDGDIRRNISKDMLGLPISDIMTSKPMVAHKDELAAVTLRRMTAGNTKIMQMFIVEEGRAVGIVHLHDFLRAGLM